MTAQNKTTIKGYFQAGDKPTEAQFVDLIDSYQDASTVLNYLATAAATAPSGTVPVADGLGGLTYTQVPAPTTFANITVSGKATVSALNAATSEVSGNATFGGDVAVSGALTAPRLQGPVTLNGAVTVSGTANFRAAIDVSATCNHYGNDVLNGNYIGYSEKVFNVGVVSGSVALYYDNGPIQTMRLGGSITALTINRWPASGKRGSLTALMQQDNVGGRTITLSSTYNTPAGSGITLSTTASAVDEALFRSNDAGTVVFANIIKDYK